MEERNTPLKYVAQAGTSPLKLFGGGGGASGGGGGFGAAVKGAAKEDPGAFGQIASGLAGIAGGLIGGRARRREQRAARAELAQRKSEYENFEFKDPSADLTNPFEYLTVN